MIETIVIFIEQFFNIKSHIDLYILFLLIIFFIFLTLSLFLISHFRKKVLFLKIFLMLFFGTILLGHMLPGTAKNINDIEKVLLFNHMLNIFGFSVKKEREYEYLYHYVSEEENKIYLLMKNIENNVPVFLFTELDKKKLEELENMLSQIRLKSRKDQNIEKSVKIKLYITEGFMKSFEMKFEEYDIKAKIPDIKKEIE